MKGHQKQTTSYLLLANFNSVILLLFLSQIVIPLIFLSSLTVPAIFYRYEPCGEPCLTLLSIFIISLKNLLVKIVLLAHSTSLEMTKLVLRILAHITSSKLTKPVLRSHYLNPLLTDTIKGL